MGSSDSLKGRFAGLKRAGERIESQSLTPHPEVPESMPAAPAEATTSSTLKQRLGGEQAPRTATVRMSVEMPQAMHQQITMIANRAGIAKVEVVRAILEETLPDLI